MTQIYERVTGQLVQMLEAGQGLRGWVRPWVIQKPTNLRTGHRYSGLINLMTLGFQSLLKGYSDALWASYQQVRQAGGHVKAGEKSTMVIFCKTVNAKAATVDEATAEPEVDISEAEPKRRRYRVYKLYPLFNLSQTTLAAEKFRERFGKPAPSADEVTAKAEAWIGSIDHKVIFGGSVAAYLRKRDVIRMPNKQDFLTEHDYISTYAHELGHFTGHEVRLNRPLAGIRDSDEYRHEELVAELTSALICADFGIDSERVQSPAYLDHWLSQMRKEPKYLFEVAGYANKAAEYLRQAAKH